MQVSLIKSTPTFDHGRLVKSVTPLHTCECEPDEVEDLIEEWGEATHVMIDGAKPRRITR